MKKHLLKSLLALALVLITGNAWGAYYLEKVTSVAAGNKYVFVQDGHAMSDAVSSSALQTVTDYLTKGLSGSESYVWTLEAKGVCFYLKNVNKNQYLNNLSSTGVSFSATASSEWNITFSDGVALFSNTSNSNRFLGYTNATSYAYKAYATSNLDSYDHEIEVYQLVEGNTTDPSISANNVTIESDATSGEIAYTITNPVDGQSVTASTTTDWISNIQVGTEKVTFTTTANTGAERQGTITLSYEGANDKEVTVTQKKAIPVYTTIADVYAAAIEVESTKTDAKVTFNGWIVTGVKGSNVYVTDGTNGLIIYQSGHGFVVGDVLSGTVACQVCLYNKSAELVGVTTSSEGLTVSKNGNVTPVEVSIADMSGKNTGAVVSIKNVTYNGSVFSDGTNTIKPYNTFITLPSLVSGKKYNITGVYVQYNDTKEIAPRTTEDFAEVPATKYEVNISSSENGTVEADVEEATEGQVVTLTITPADHYKLASLNVTDVNEQLVTVTDNKFTMPASNVTASATFEPLEYKTVTWMSNGEQYGQKTTVYENETLTLATAPTAPSGYVFMGWTSTETVISDGSGIVYATAGGKVDDDIIYYAVFAKEDVEGEASLVKLDGSSALSSGDNIVIVASGENWTYALKQETVSKSYVSYYAFDGQLSTVKADSKNYLTLSSSDDAWKLGDDTNGYLYNSSSNDLSISTEYNSSWTIAWNTTEGKFSIKNGTRWLSCRNDLTGDNQYKFRGGGTSTANGTVYFDLYKITESTTSYSNFTTILPRSFSAQISDAGFATLYLEFDAAIPTNMTAYTATYEKQTITLHEIEGGVIPAETAVVLKGEAGDYDFEESLYTGEPLENALCGTAEESSYEMLQGTETDKYVYTLNQGDNGVGFFHMTNSETSKLAANRAYLLIPKADFADGAGTIGLRFGDATQIENVNAAKADKYFDLMGREVLNPAGGIYILNGKKVLVK